MPGQAQRKLMFCWLIVKPTLTTHISTQVTEHESFRCNSNLQRRTCHFTHVEEGELGLVWSRQKENVKKFSNSCS